MKTHYAHCDRSNESDPQDWWSNTLCGLEYTESPMDDRIQYVTCKKCKKMYEKCRLNAKKYEVIISNIKLVNASEFAKCASVSHIYNVNKFQAEFLNKNYGIDVLWYSCKKDGENFDSYLVDLGYGKNEMMIGSKLRKVVYDVFKDLGYRPNDKM